MDILGVADGGIWLRSALATGTSIGRKGVLLVTKDGDLYWHVVADGTSYGSSLGAVSAFTPEVVSANGRVEPTRETIPAAVGRSMTSP